MVDNQHTLIKGSRDLSVEEIALMNEAKDLATKCGMLVTKLTTAHPIDQRCVALAKTNLQQGFMWLIRAIARPETFG
jgi:hypothetical protein